MELTDIEQEHLTRLQKRAVFLQQRTAGKPHLTHDVKELKALLWALARLRLLDKKTEADQR